MLVDAGLVSRDKRGLWSHYALVPGALESLTSALASSVLPAGRDLATLPA